MSAKEIQSKIFALLQERAVGKTICPSEVLAPSQRKNKIKMAEVRKVAVRLARAKKLELTQRGRLIDIENIRGPIRLRLPRSLVPFEYLGVDFRKEAKRYQVGRGEQGVLSVEPYKSEILPFWKFKTPAMAEVSAKKILQIFRSYKKQKDFVGMDMARKFLQMGYTRSRRYANHRDGKKYIGAVPIHMKGRSGAHGREIAPRALDLEKARSAEIFKRAWKQVEADKFYARLKLRWKAETG